MTDSGLSWARMRGISILNSAKLAYDKQQQQPPNMHKIA